MRSATVLLVLVLFAASCLAGTPTRKTREVLKPEGRIFYKGTQLWKTEVDSEEKVQVLVKLKNENRIKMWGGNNATALDIQVKPDDVEFVAGVLKENNIVFMVTIMDLQKAIDEENPTTIELDDRRGHRLTWQAYHRLNDIHGYVDYLAATYPKICSVQTIGNSVEGRAIKVLKISNGNPGNKAVWIDGGIHAREWISPATVTYFINSVVADYESQPHSLKNLDLYIAPVLNPDGYEYSHVTDRLWRKNRAYSGGACVGTDLNRNFGYRWGTKGVSHNPCADTYGGRHAFSEPETSAVRDFLTGPTSSNWKAYVSFHSYGQYILYPWGYDSKVPPDYKDLDRVGQQAAQAIRQAGGPAYTVGPASSTLYPAAGGSDDWAKAVPRLKYAYTIELRDNGRYGFVLPARYIQPTATEAIAALHVILDAAYKA